MTGAEQTALKERLQQARVLELALGDCERLIAICEGWHASGTPRAWPDSDLIIADAWPELVAAVQALAKKRLAHLQQEWNDL